MGVEVFEKFIREKCPGAFVNVDLLKIAQGIGARTNQKRLLSNSSQAHLRPPGNLCVVIDGECCLDRLYGGFFNDWACGGQWNRMLQFLQLLMATMQGNHISVVVFFNGAMENKRFKNWAKEETANLDKVFQVMRHIRRKCTPPPKVLWMPPAALRTCLRLALRHLMIPVVQSVDDHMQEVMSFLREHDYDALLVEGIEYVFFDPPSYYSAEAIKLTFRGSLETKELILDEVAKHLNLHPQRFPLLAALLGNFLLPSEELSCFYEELLGTSKTGEDNYQQLVNAVLAFVRNLSSIDDVAAIAQFIFRQVDDEKIKKDKTGRFVRSVEYYMNGTKENFSKFTKPASLSASVSSTTKPEQFASDSQEEEDRQPTAPIRELTAQDLDSFKKQFEKATLEDSGVSTNSQSQSESVAAAATATATDDSSASAAGSSLTRLSTERDGDAISNERTKSPPDAPSSSGADSAAVGTGSSVPANSSSATAAKETIPCAASAAFEAAKSAVKQETSADHYIPQVPPEIVRAAFHRHQKGLMHRWIYQVLSKSEIKIECHLEEGNELPYGWQLWRGVRQHVYAILFNLNHRHFLLKQRATAASSTSATSSASSRQSTNTAATNSTSGGGSATKSKAGDEPGKYPADSATRIFVKEWVCNARRHPYQQADMVEAVALPWKGVPTVQRLWFGQQPEDKKKRLKAFLSCLGADTNLMLDQSHVPQHLLLMCCVLRYMVAYSSQRILQRHELDSFLAQAVSPQLMDPNSLQELQIRTLTPRGVQLAQLFMQGIEHALLANDACGAPIPWVMCCPWLFFDGKLLQLKFDIAERKRTLLEICNGEVEQVSQVERMRQAVLEGLEMTYAPPIVIPMPNRPPTLVPTLYHQGQPRAGSLPMDFAHRLASSTVRTRGMIGRREILTRGGQLEIAGVVVGQWGGSADKNKVRGSMPSHFNQQPRMNPTGRPVGPPTSMAGGPARYLPPPPPASVAAGYNVPALMRPHVPTEFYAGAGMFPIGFAPLQAPAPSMAAAIARANNNAAAAVMVANAQRFRDRVPDMRRRPPSNPITTIHIGKPANDNIRAGMIEPQAAQPHTIMTASNPHSSTSGAGAGVN